MSSQKNSLPPLPQGNIQSHSSSTIATVFPNLPNINHSQISPISPQLVVNHGISHSPIMSHINNNNTNTNISMPPPPPSTDDTDDNIIKFDYDAFITTLLDEKACCKKAITNNNNNDNIDEIKEESPSLPVTPIFSNIITDSRSSPASPTSVFSDKSDKSSILSMLTIEPLNLQINESYRSKILTNILLLLFRYHPNGIFESTLPRLYHQMFGEFIFLTYDIKQILHSANANKLIIITKTKHKGILYTCTPNCHIHLKVLGLDLQKYLIEHILRVFYYFPNGIAVNCFAQTFSKLTQLKLTDFSCAPVWLIFVRSIPHIISFMSRGQQVLMNTYNTETVNQFNSNLTLFKCVGYEDLFTHICYTHCHKDKRCCSGLNRQEFESSFLIRFKMHINSEAPYIASILLKMKQPFSDKNNHTTKQVKQVIQINQQIINQSLMPLNNTGHHDAINNTTHVHNISNNIFVPTRGGYCADNQKHEHEITPTQVTQTTHGGCCSKYKKVNCCKTNDIIINNQHVSVPCCTSQTTCKNQNIQNNEHCAVFMGGFSRTTKVNDIKNKLKLMGFNVVNCTEIKHKTFGFSWVTLSNIGQVEQLIKLSPIEIMGNKIDIKWSNKSIIKKKPNEKKILKKMIQLVSKYDKKNGSTIVAMQSRLSKTFSYKISIQDLSQIVVQNSNKLYIKSDNKTGTKRIFITQ